MVSGKLVLKGGVSLKKKKPKKKKKKLKMKKRRVQENASVIEDAEQKDDVVRKVLGVGRIISSATAVTGTSTKFMDQIAVGDGILVQHASTLAEEVRRVTMVLSNVSLCLSSPFSNDLVSTTAFHVIVMPKEKKMPARISEEGNDANTASSGLLTTYRVRKGGKNSSGNYYTITERVDGSMSRGELLDMRCKKKSDRYAC